MRIKLRLYSRDLDLIALKYTPEFRLGNAIRTALTEYVRDGAVSRIHVEMSEDLPELPSLDQIDISLANETYADVIAWLTGLKPGFRSVAVKTIIRSAIGNPILEMYAADAQVRACSPPKSDTNVSHSPVQKLDEEVALQPTMVYATPNVTPKPPTMKSEATYETSQPDDEELDLFEFDAFDNI